MASVSEDLASLSRAVEATEDELRVDHVPYLQLHEGALERVQQFPSQERPRMDPGALIDQAKHLGNLTFDVWNNMKDVVIYTPMVLDPNSAAPDIVLSEDLTEVRKGREERLSDIRRRNPLHMVHCTQGLRFGSHSWEADVSGNKSWMLGVRTLPDPRKGPAFKWWELMFRNGKYYTVPPLEVGAHKAIPTGKVFQRIRVNLDFDRGTLSFYDPETNAHISIITHPFAGRTLFPHVYTDDSIPVKILPVKVFVTVKPLKSW